MRGRRRERKKRRGEERRKEREKEEEGEKEMERYVDKQTGAYQMICIFSMQYYIALLSLQSVPLTTQQGR